MRWPVFKQLKVKGGDLALYGKPISELRSVTCRMGSHSVTYHPTQLNAPSLNPSHISWCSIYLPRKMEGWVDLDRWLHTEMVSCPQAVNHQSTDPARCSVTSLIGRDELPLRQATNFCSPRYVTIMMMRSINLHSVTFRSVAWICR